MDAVAWAQVVSPIVAAAAIVVAAAWVVRDRRRLVARTDGERLEAYRRADEDRLATERQAIARRNSDLALRVALAFERHQAGDVLAGADCRALLLAVEQRLPVTRLLYLGEAAWQPEDNPRIEAMASFYGLPVSVDLARHEIRHELQGTQFVVYSRDGMALPVSSSDGGMRGSVRPAASSRELRMRLRHAPRHARTS